MVSLTPGPVSFSRSRSSFTYSDTPWSLTCVLAFNPLSSPKNSLSSASLSLLAATVCGGPYYLGFLDVKRKRGSCSWCSGILMTCKKNVNMDWDCEGTDELEAEILEFMKNSEKPRMFPTKKELIGAGRFDLVEAIENHGGWLAMGWDKDEYQEAKEEEGQKLGHFAVQKNDNVSDGDLNIENHLQNGYSQERIGAWSFGISDSAVHYFTSSLASASDTSLEVDAGCDSGIEGILSGLEKERNLNLGLNLREKEKNNGGESNILLPQSSMNTTVGDLRTTCEPEFNGCVSLSEHEENKLQEIKSVSGMNGSRNSPKHETWRTWSMRRAGWSDSVFESAEICPSDLNDGKKNVVQENDVLDKNWGCNDSTKARESSNHLPEEINQRHIKSRIQHLQLELSSVLHSLRSHSSEGVSSKDGEIHLCNLENFDAWEFQENEILKARDKLRSTQAKLAVLEGKMAMAIIDARRVVEEKQGRIDHARKALQLLRTACIVWHNSASEVLLAGSFDGWSTQRKMERSNHGVFSLSLKLYPGKYQIKFIVDGQWKVDPLRPIVNYDGHENNLLIIT